MSDTVKKSTPKSRSTHGLMNDKLRLEYVKDMNNWELMETSDTELVIYRFKPFPVFKAIGPSHRVYSSMFDAFFRIYRFCYDSCGSGFLFCDSLERIVEFLRSNHF